MSNTDDKVVARRNLGFSDLATGAGVTAAAISDLGIGGPVGAAAQGVNTVASALQVANAVRTAGLGVRGTQTPTDRFKLRDTSPELSDDQFLENRRQSMLTYPLDLPDYNIGFLFSEYNFRDRNRDGNLTESSRDGIFLPMPRELIEGFSVSYSQAQLGPIVTNMMNAIEGQGGLREQLTDPNSPRAGIGSVISAARGAITNGSPLWAAYAARVAGNIASSSGIPYVSGEAAAAAVFTSMNSVPNPNLTLLLQGTQLRQHRFSWIFAPRTEQESERIRDIIQRFRVAMLPDDRDGNWTLKFPEVCSIKLFTPNGNGDEYLYKFPKKCLVTDAFVNYAASGIPSFLAGTSAPAAVGFTIILSEFEQLMRRDYDNRAGGTS